MGFKMEWLTRKKEQAKKKREREARKRSNEAIKIYDRGGKRAFKVNAFANNIADLPYDQDNHREYGSAELMTEDEVLESVLFAGKRFRVRKSDVKLCPDMVTEEIKDYYRSKIVSCSVRSAKNKRDK